MKPFFAVILSIFLVGFARADCVCCFSIERELAASEQPVSSGCCGKSESSENTVPPLSDCCSSSQCALSDCGELTFAGLENEAIIDLRTLIVTEPQMSDSEILFSAFVNSYATRAPPLVELGQSQSLTILFCVHRL